MRMVPVNKETVNYKPTKLLAIFEEFQNCGADCVELVDHNYKSPAVAVAVLNTALSRYNIRTVKAFRRLGHVYLMRL